MIVCYLIKLRYFTLSRIFLEKILQARFADSSDAAILTCPLSSRVQDMITKQLKEIKLKQD